MSVTNLLIIDDEPAIRKLLRAALEGGVGDRFISELTASRIPAKTSPAR